MGTDNGLKEGLRNHLTECREKEVGPSMAGKAERKGSLASLSCSKVAGCENGTCFDDNAMKPLRLFAEEDRRKSAPAFPAQRGGERYTCSKDTSSEFSESIIRFLSDDDSLASFSAADLTKTTKEEEEHSVAGSTNMFLPEEDACGAHHAHDERLRLNYRHCKRIGQWQGKVEVALRRSIALDTSLSPAAKSIMTSPRIVHGPTVTPRRSLHLRSANAMLQAQEINFIHNSRKATRTKLDAAGHRHGHGTYTHPRINKSFSLSQSSYEKHEKKKAIQREQTEYFNHQMQSQLEETQSLRVQLQELQASLHNAEQEKAKLLQNMREQNTQRELDIRSKEACILKLETEANNAARKQQAGDCEAKASFVVESNATTCAVALMSKIDSLVHEKEELRSVLARLWSRVQAPHQGPL
jgi:hypothetical protein